MRRRQRARRRARAELRFELSLWQCQAAAVRGDLQRQGVEGGGRQRERRDGAQRVAGDGGGERIADEYDVPLLGKLPLALEIRKGLDEGKPLVAVSPNSALANQYHHIARRLAAQLCVPSADAMRAGPKIVVSND